METAEKRLSGDTTLNGVEAIRFLEDKARLARGLGEGWKISISPETLESYCEVMRWAHRLQQQRDGARFTWWALGSAFCLGWAVSLMLH